MSEDLTWTEVYRIVGHAGADGVTDCGLCGAMTRNPFDHAEWHIDEEMEKRPTRGASDEGRRS